MKRWFILDTHFSHKNIIISCLNSGGCQTVGLINKKAGREAHERKDSPGA